MRVVWYVLVTGCRSEDVSTEMGCSGRTVHRRLWLWEELGTWDRLHADLFRLLQQAERLDSDTVVVDYVVVRAHASDQSGPTPKRRKEDSDYTLMADRHSASMGLRTAPAASVHTEILPLVSANLRVQGRPGRPKERFHALYADRGFDTNNSRALSPWLAIKPHIARRPTVHGSGLGRVRWVVERRMRWLNGLRWRCARYDCLVLIQEARNTFGGCDLLSAAS